MTKNDVLPYVGKQAILDLFYAGGTGIRPGLVLIVSATDDGLTFQTDSNASQFAPYHGVRSISPATNQQTPSLGVNTASLFGISGWTLLFVGGLLVVGALWYANHQTK